MSKLSLSALATKINDTIKTNANREITATQLNEILIDIRDSMQHQDSDFPAGQVNGTFLASKISNFQATVSANSDVSAAKWLADNIASVISAHAAVTANTNARHSHDQSLDTADDVEFNSVKAIVKDSSGYQVVGDQQSDITNPSAIPEIAHLDDVTPVLENFHEKIRDILNTMRAHGLIG